MYVYCVVCYCSAALAAGYVWISWCTKWYRFEICCHCLHAEFNGEDLTHTLRLLKVVIVMASSTDNSRPTALCNVIFVIVIVGCTHHSQLNLISLHKLKCTNLPGAWSWICLQIFLNRNHFPSTILLISLNFWSSSSEQSHNYTKECAKLNFFGECLGQDAYSIRLHILLGTLRSQFIQSETEKRRQICRGGRGAKWQILRLGTYTYFRRSLVSESVEV